MNERLVSVIVPVYNGERWLTATIESLLAQDHEPLEVIVVDDGSTDGSVALIEQFGDVQLYRQANAGVAAARNAGVARAGGAFLAFCDQDDRHVPWKTTRQLDYLDAHPDVGVVMGRQEIEIEEGVDPPKWLVRDDVYGDLGGVLPLSCLARREVYDLVGPFDQAISGSDDFDWVARAKAGGHGVDVLDEIVVLRTIHDSNASHEPGMLRRGTAMTMHKLLKARRDAEGGMSLTVSVIVCVYNSERYVAETLEHIQAQTRPADELIVVDDGSTDSSRAVLDRFVPPARLVARETNGGIGLARNTGIAEATGDLVAFCDSDDLWEPTKLQRQVRVFERQPDVDAVFTAVHEFVSPDVDPSTMALRPVLEHAVGPLTSTMLVRREVFHRVGGFDVARGVGDWMEWYMRMHDSGAREVRLDDVLVQRRLHGDNNSMRISESRPDYLHAIKAHLDRTRRREDPQ